MDIKLYIINILILILLFFIIYNYIKINKFKIGDI